MSIRLRLTLLFSTILTLTLIVFSATLYITQSQLTFDAIKATLVRQAEGIANIEKRMQRRNETTSISTMPGRWSQMRNPDGSVVALTADLAGSPLPLSEAGLKAIQGGAPWIEAAEVDEDPLLIYSHPLIVQERVTRIIQVASPISERNNSLNLLSLVLIIASGLTILAAFAISWALAGAALRPIHQITHTAQAIGAERNFGRRVNHAGPNDEIGQLAVTFNAMLTELESAYRQVEQTLNAQRRFVADASHELRTPLTTIRGNIELLHHEPPIDAKEQADVLSDTKDEVERLIRLVGQLLVLARADARRPLRREPLEIRPLLEDVYRQAKLLASHRTITLETEDEAEIVGDSDALKQVLLILLDNALVHTTAHASINIFTQLTEQQVAFGIRDSGPGIAPELLSHIFERFYRGDAARSGGGSGLGLSIAKELVEAQDGSLNVESQVGHGSSFIVTLPRADRSPE